MSVGYNIKYVHVKHESTFIILPFEINNNCYTQLRYYSQAKDNFFGIKSSKCTMFETRLEVYVFVLTPAFIING